MQEPAADAEYDPAAQGVQEEEPAAENVPAVQVKDMTGVLVSPRKA
jgi:hypothetical protein